MMKPKEKFEIKIQGLLDKSEAVDQEYDRGTTMTGRVCWPSEFKKRGTCLKKINEAMRAMEAAASVKTADKHLYK